MNIPSPPSFKYLKKHVSIAAVLSDKGLLCRFKKHSNQLIGPCPLHKGDNPRAFVVNLSKNIWYCFTGCNCGGDLIDFVRKLDGKSYRQIAEYLTSLTSVSPPPVPMPVKKSFQPFTKRLTLDSSSVFFQKKGITQGTAKRFEAGLYHGPGFLEGCIGVRLHDLDGCPIGYAGRRTCAENAENYGKWKFPPNLPKNEIVYNFHRVHNNVQKGLVIVECPWGVMRLSQLNIPAVALLGVSLSPLGCNILKKIRKIILLLDGDPAGRLATTNIYKTLKGHTEVQFIHLPAGVDPDDLNDLDLSLIAKIFFSN